MADQNEQKKKVLIVEDASVFRNILENQLKKGDHEVFSATNGEEGVVAAEEHKPDVIVTDVYMPRMDGLEMIGKIRGTEWGAQIPVLILTNITPDAETSAQIDTLQNTKFLIKAEASLDVISNEVKKLLSHAPEPQDNPDAAPAPAPPQTAA